MRPMDVDKLIKRLEAQPSKHLDQRIDALLGSRPSPAATRMWPRITKLAIAAIVLLALLIALPLFNGDDSNVWARALENTRDIGNYTYRYTTIERRPSGEEIQETAICHVWRDHGIYIDGYTQGQRLHKTYIVYDSNERIVVYPATKEYERAPWRSPDRLDTPKEMAVWLLNGHYTELGRKTIDGRVCLGIESHRGPDTQPKRVVNSDSQIWFDAETLLPASIEIVHTYMGSSRVIRQDQFQYGVEFPADLLQTHIPDDYTPAVISGLRLFAELTGSRYPKHLDEGIIRGQVGGPAEVEKAMEANSLPRDRYEYESLLRVAHFYYRLLEEPNDMAYFGDRITAEDHNRVLMYWKDSAPSYQLVWGDLRVETVSRDQLIERCYAAGDGECLIDLLEKDDGTRAAVLAGYLAQFGDISSIPVLLRHADNWRGVAADNPFPQAAEAIHRRYEQLHPSTSLMVGRLLYASGNVPSRAAIDIGGRQWIVDYHGYFAVGIPSASAGEEHLGYAAAGFGAVARLFFWSRGDRVEPVTIILDWASSIRGRIVNSDGAPQARVEIGLTARPGGDTGYSWPDGKRTKADATGRFSFEDVPVGAALELVIGGAESPARVPIGEMEPDRQVDLGDIVLRSAAAEPNEAPQTEGVLQ